MVEDTVTALRELGLEAVRRSDVFQEVLDKIGTYIEQNHLEAGDRLPSDRDLAAALGVSRPLVRQALKVLEGLGRVSAHQGSGTFVRDASHRVAVEELTRGLAFDRRLLLDVLPVRIAIELAILRASATRLTPETLAVLESTVAERGACIAEDPKESSLDLSFEARLGELCGNEILRRLQALIHDVWLRAQLATHAAPADRLALHRDHLDIYESLRSGDIEAAAHQFEAHLRSLSRA